MRAYGSTMERLIIVSTNSASVWPALRPWNASFVFDNDTNGNAGMTSDWLEPKATAHMWTLDSSNALKLWYYVYNTTNENDQAPANVAYGEWAEGWQLS